MENILQDVDAIIDRWGAKPESLLQIMLDVNHHFNYLPRESIVRIAQCLGMPVSHVYSVATFFKVFSLTPRGRTIVHVCTGTACHVRGAPKLLDRVRQDLGLDPGQTTEDLAITLETVNCVGACASAPVVVVNGETHSEMTPNKMAALVKEIEKQSA
ncbi:NADH-quinone oxidoreductase subunit E [Desulfacinum hydrothermale DSM 13146]|uniref:NADH-quinone oxidoreductase subunit E n=1 Tax=Desulfacinum hydrothermale DSM 13146 TaxID=1121390 RepID=A0A1W1XN18_9BACT|nr:NAD(P)H-dependent oxidoreductase subunit E [Desulfacinum hydrothermale]SMC25262.1 NADH-quinone oxidoreductase subunit E [Desulfacinum hydrothermale DSM 13146]